jgi:ribosome-associated protein
MAPIRISPKISIDDSEIQMDFVLSSGPGGQNVNKNATCVQLRFDAAGSESLPEDVRQRLLKQARNRLTGDGEILIEAKRYRSQHRNREDAIQRLKKMILRAEKPPKKRRRTRPTRASKERRLKAKKERSEKKRLRRNPPKPPR